jgi:hypothetical protein
MDSRMRNPPSLNWLIAGPLLLLVGLQLMQYRETDSIGERLAKLEAGHQQLQGAYLNGTRESRAQLAQSLGYHAVPMPPGRSSPYGQGLAGGPGTVIGGGDLLPAQVAQQIRQQRVQLEKDFSSEPINPKWAGDTTQAVEDLLQQSATAGHTLRSAQVDCRSRTCRIKFDVGIGDNIDDLTQTLLTDMAARLPSTKMLRQLSADGQGMELTFYASAPSH